jgi:hypothetical protein
VSGVFLRLEKCVVRRSDAMESEMTNGVDVTLNESYLRVRQRVPVGVTRG